MLLPLVFPRVFLLSLSVFVPSIGLLVWAVLLSLPLMACFAILFVAVFAFVSMPSGHALPPALSRLCFMFACACSPVASRRLFSAQLFFVCPVSLLVRPVCLPRPLYGVFCDAFHGSRVCLPCLAGFLLFCRAFPSAWSRCIRRCLRGFCVCFCSLVLAWRRSLLSFICVRPVGLLVMPVRLFPPLHGEFCDASGGSRICFVRLSSPIRMRGLFFCRGVGWCRIGVVLGVVFYYLSVAPCAGFRGVFSRGSRASCSPSYAPSCSWLRRWAFFCVIACCPPLLVGPVLGH